MVANQGQAMAKKKSSVPSHWQPWIEARRKLRLSHAHVQMALELGLNPKKLGKLDNHHQEPWKLPLPDFIAKLYRKRCGKDRPDTVRSIEEMAEAKRAKVLAKKASKAMRGRTLDADPSLRAGEGTCRTTAAADGGTRAKHRQAMSSAASGEPTGFERQAFDEIIE
jgi:hypothetical protein